VLHQRCSLRLVCVCVSDDLRQHLLRRHIKSQIWHTTHPSLRTLPAGKRHACWQESNLPPGVFKQACWPEVGWRGCGARNLSEILTPWLTLFCSAVEGRVVVDGSLTTSRWTWQKSGACLLIVGYNFLHPSKKKATSQPTCLTLLPFSYWWRGPGTAFEFSLSLVNQLFGREKMEAVAGPMVRMQHAWYTCRWSKYLLIIQAIGIQACRQLLKKFLCLLILLKLLSCSISDCQMATMGHYCKSTSKGRSPHLGVL
jgi:hypothetical protein